MVGEHYCLFALAYHQVLFHHIDKRKLIVRAQKRYIVGEILSGHDIDSHIQHYFGLIDLAAFYKFIGNFGKHLPYRLYGHKGIDVLIIHVDCSVFERIKPICFSEDFIHFVLVNLGILTHIRGVDGHEFIGHTINLKPIFETKIQVGSGRNAVNRPVPLVGREEVQDYERGLAYPVGVNIEHYGVYDLVIILFSYNPILLDILFIDGNQQLFGREKVSLAVGEFILWIAENIYSL